MGGDRTYKGDLRELLQTFSKLAIEGERIYSDMAKVLSVNESEKTCEIQVINGPKITDVRLQQVASDNGMLIIPEINSVVIISYTDKTTAYVSMFSQINSVIYQGGTNGGLTITPELVTQLGYLSARVDTIINAIKTAAVVAGDGGATFKTNMITVLNTIINEEDFSGIENDKFKH